MKYFKPCRDDLFDIFEQLVNEKEISLPPPSLHLNPYFTPADKFIPEACIALIG